MRESSELTAADELRRTTKIYYSWHSMRHAHLLAARPARPVATPSAASARPSPSAGDSGKATPKRRRRELWIELQATKPPGRSADTAKDANAAQLLTVLLLDHTISEGEPTEFIVVGYRADDEGDVVLACKAKGVVHLRLLPWEYLPRGAHTILQRDLSRRTPAAELSIRYKHENFVSAHYQRGLDDRMPVSYIVTGPLQGRTCNEVPLRTRARPASATPRPLRGH